MHQVYIINFGKDYVNLLSPLSEKVNSVALLTLAYFCDPPMRCFRFQDFQLAPVLEQFERLVRILMKNKLPFMGMDESLKHEVIYDALLMDKKDVTYNLEAKRNTKGF